jgi:spore maturation protein CgeB
MRILIAGDWHSELHEEVMSQSLKKMGHDVSEFKWFYFFQSTRSWWSWCKKIWLRIQNKYIAGPVVAQLNTEFLSCCCKTNPDLIFIYRGTHIRPDTLIQARAILPNAVFVGYNNDDPFSPSQPRYLWRLFLACLPYYDLVLAYRNVNISEYISAGAQRVELFRSWYVPSRNYPIELTASQQEYFKSDVVFVGHYENDYRFECFELLIQAGVKFKLFGPGYEWNPMLSKSNYLRELAPIRLVWGEEYNQALVGSKIALCFLSKLNRDTYTRRCFEIPAAGVMLLSEYSEDLAGLFHEGVEADYFRSPQEMIEKILFYLNNDALRKRVAYSGRARLLRDGHDVDSRMIQLMSWVDQIV